MEPARSRRRRRVCLVAISGYVVAGCDAGGTAVIGAELETAPRFEEADANVGAIPGSSDGATPATCGPRPASAFCAEVPALGAPPIIDGVLDCGPSLSTIVPISWTVDGAGADGGAFPADNSAAVAVAWRPDGLYVFVAVTDPLLVPATAASPSFYGDAVEIYVDSDGAFANPPQYDSPGTIQLTAEAPTDAFTSSRRGERYSDQSDEGPWSSTQWGTFPTASGYAVEAFVTAADLGLSSWSLASGQHVGFDIAVDVSYDTVAMTGPKGHRLGQYWMHVGPPPDLLPYQDVRSFCLPALATP